MGQYKNGRWRPSRAEARSFSNRMKNDNEFAAAYNARKEEKEKKRRHGSKFDYKSAGGEFVPTREQHDFAMSILRSDVIVRYGSDKEKRDTEDACNMVANGYISQERIHHDYIHIVNNLKRQAGL